MSQVPPTKDKIRPRKIKIIFVIDILIGFAGTEKHLFDTITYLNKEIFSCCVVSFKAREWVVEEFKKVGAEILIIHLDKIYGLHALKQFYILVSYMKKVAPDIVQTFHLKSDTFGVLAAKASGTPCIVSSRRDIGDLKKKSHILLNRFTNQWIDKYISVCEAVAERLQKNEHVPPEKIKVIYNGVDTKKFYMNPNEMSNIRKNLNIPADSFIVGIVSNFRPEKDILCFFKAMAILQCKIKNLRIIAAGCGKNEVQKRIGEQIIQFCRENNLLCHVLFPGYAKDVRPYIAVMDVACLTPVKNEGFSNAILEEMSMGKPVVATDVGGNGESVLDGETGFIIPPNNPEQLAEKILFLYKNPEQRKCMDIKARERTEIIFSLETMIQNMEAFYMSVCKKGTV